MPVKKNESSRRLLLCINGILQKKAKDVMALKVKEISSFTDYLLICSGTTETQVQAIASAVQQYMKKEGILPLGVEGEKSGQWILLDYDDVVISIFQESIRSFYAIEDLWNAPRMIIAENTTEVKRLSKGMS